jgi:ribosome maturation factor RimP
MANVEQIQTLIQPSVEALGYELWGLQMLNQGKFSTLRIYIENRDNGITVDDCAKVSHQVSGILDVEDPISSKYTLEVSSPGLDRPLFSLAQYQAYIGSAVKVKLRVPFDGRKKFTGVLTGIEDEDVVVHVDSEEYLLPLDAIDKANIIGDIKDSSEGKNEK